MDEPTAESDHPTGQFGAEPHSRRAEPRVELASAEPKIFGVVPPLLALLVGVAAMAVGIVLLLGDGPLVAVIWLAAGGALVALAVDASRRWPASTLPRVTVTVIDWLGRHLGLARVSAGAWADASRRVMALRREMRSLRGERDERITALGEAAYREDPDEARAQRERIAGIDERIARCRAEIEEVMDAARARVQRERVAAQPTESFAVPEVPPPLAEDDETRTAPTAARSRFPVGRA